MTYTNKLPTDRQLTGSRGCFSALGNRPFRHKFSKNHPPSRGAGEDRSLRRAVPAQQRKPETHNVKLRKVKKGQERLRWWVSLMYTGIASHFATEF